MTFERSIPKVSICIPSWFTPTQHGKYGEHETFWFARECLWQLLQNTPRDLYELIIVDNGSTLTDMDLRMAKSFAGAYRNAEYSPRHYFDTADVCIRNVANLGFAPACNQAFALARGEYVVCLNNDILVWPGWLEKILAVFELKVDPPVGVVMPALITETGDAREALKLQTVSTERNAGIVSPGGEFGSLWVVKRATLDALREKDGYVFDENFKLGMGEDRDLWDRIRLLGLQTYKTHDVRVFHQGNMSIGKVANRKEFTTKNREYLAKKREERKNI